MKCANLETPLCSYALNLCVEFIYDNDNYRYLHHTHYQLNNDYMYLLLPKSVH